jgi:hypothetical protein
LPSSLLAEIEQLWGTCMLPRWPERVISEPFPHKLFAETFGPALKFWHGCALTAWFICEGPSSRTDLAGLAEYYRKDVQALKEMGTPINERIFEDLARVEAQLGQPQSFTRLVTAPQEPFARAATSMRIYGTQRKGFEKLRDIISSYRRQWAERYLEQYLQKRWETEIREMARSYKLSLDKNGVALTAKQFAKDTNTATNHWFGGNISELYKAIQVQSPIQLQRHAILPTDRVAFAFTVFEELNHKGPKIAQHDSQAKHLANSHYYQLNKLAALSFWYVQLEEALGHPPILQEFGSSKFGQASEALHEDINQAWKIFSSAIYTAKKLLPPPAVNYKRIENVPVRLRSETMPEHTKTILTDRSTSSPIEQPVVQLNRETILKLQEEAAQLQERLIIEEEEIQEHPPISSVSPSISLVSMVREIPGTPSEVQHEPLKNVPASLKPETTQEYAKAEFENRKVAPSPEIQPVVQLNQETILKLQEEAAQLQERLIIEEDEVQEQPSIPSMSAFISPVSVVREPIEISPEINEDWQVVLQQWQPEHWEILRLLCLGQSVQLTIEERKDRRPISQLIDEINVPVDEYIGDLLIDPDTQTLSPHLRVAAENLVSWYYSSKR